MSPPFHLSRRELLRASMLAAGALAVPNLLAACSKGAPPSTTSKGPLDDLKSSLLDQGAREGLSVFLAGEDYVDETENYIAFGLVQADSPIMGVDARVWIATGDREPLGPFMAPWGDYAKPDAPPPAPQGINAADLTFTQPGIWQALVEVEAGSGSLVGTAALMVKAKDDAGTRTVGEQAPKSETPTRQRPRGVDPICTRSPICGFHQITLAEAISSGKPTALIVATPKFCMSRTCGPNLEELILVADEVGARANFVHAEVYRSDDPDDIRQHAVSPTFLEWQLQSEPWLFLIDGQGSVAERFEGPIVATTIQPALDRLLLG